MILSKGPRKTRQLPLCGLKTLAAIIYLHGQICFPIWKKIHHGKNIHLQLWLLVGDQTNTNYPPSVSDSISSAAKRHQIAASRQCGSWRKKIPWKNAIFDLYIDTLFSPFQLEFAFHNQKLFHIIMISLIKGMELFWQFYKDIWWKERAGSWK